MADDESDFCEFCLSDRQGSAVTCPKCGAYEDADGWHQHWDTPGDRAMVEVRNLLAGLLALVLVGMLTGLVILAVVGLRR